MEREELIEKAREIKRSYEKVREVKDRFNQDRGGDAELRTLVVEDLGEVMGIELDERGWGFKNPDDPRIRKAREIIKEIFG